MSALARQYNAVNLSQGFPDFDCDPRLIELVNQAMKKGFNQYANMAGNEMLRESLAEKIQSQYTKVLDPDTEITITAGATQAIFTAIHAFVKENDEVIIFEPAYDCYEPAILLAGGKAIHFQLSFPDYSINWDDLKKLIRRQTKMIIINTPHNPSGAVLNAFDMMQLEKILDGTDILVLSDEVYEHIIFDQLEHQSVLRFPKLAARSLVVYSFGKTFHATGWKMGYVVAPEYLMKEFRKVHQFVVFSVHSAVQQALAEYIGDKSTYLGISSFYEEKRNLFRQGLKGSKFVLLPCQGTYFQLLSYKNIADEDDVSFAERLTKQHKIASIPLSVFYNYKTNNKVLRFCVAKKNETLQKALEILHKVS